MDDDDEDDEDVPLPDPEVIEEEEEEGDEESDGDAARLCELMSNVVFSGFEAHVRDLEAARERRREALAFRSAIEDGALPTDENSAKQTQDEIDGLGVRLPGDEYAGDVNFRTLQKLLARVDARGFERCVTTTTLQHDASLTHTTQIGAGRHNSWNFT